MFNCLNYAGFINSRHKSFHVLFYNYTFLQNKIATIPLRLKMFRLSVFQHLNKITTRL